MDMDFNPDPDPDKNLHFDVDSIHINPGWRTPVYTRSGLHPDIDLYQQCSAIDLEMPIQLFYPACVIIL